MSRFLDFLTTPPVSKDSPEDKYNLLIETMKKRGLMPERCRSIAIAGQGETYGEGNYRVPVGNLWLSAAPHSLG